MRSVLRYIRPIIMPQLNYAVTCGISATCAMVGLVLSICVPDAHGISPMMDDPKNDTVRVVAIVGFTAPYERATLSSIQQSRIVQFVVQEGDHVDVDAPLVEFDKNVQQSRVLKRKLDAETTVSIDLARSKLNHAESELDRIRKIKSDSMAVTELLAAEYEAEQMRLELAVEQLRQSRAVHDYTLELRVLEQLTLRAPFSGYITSRLKSPGEVVLEGEGLLEIVQLDPLVITVDGPAELLQHVQVDDGVSVIPADDHWKAQAGRISYISPVIDPASQTVRLRVTVPNPHGLWYAGMKVEVRIGERVQDEHDADERIANASIDGNDS